MTAEGREFQVAGANEVHFVGLLNHNS